jgi:hypothetical protein
MFSVSQFAGIAYATIPLITDDTSTQGLGNFQVELPTVYSHDDERSIRENNVAAGAILTYGIAENVDLALSGAYLWQRTRDDGTDAKANGIADTVIGVKWRFYEKDGLSFAVNPVLLLPSGDEEKGLGTGKVGYGLSAITTKQLKPWAFNAAVTFTRNENRVEDRKNLWSIGFAAEFALTEGLRLVGNIGAHRNPDPGSSTSCAFILGGFIYSPTDLLEIGFGTKFGLTRPEPDVAVIFGLTFHF